MSILGYDCEGRPIKAGDQVVAAWVARGKEKYGTKVFVVAGPSDHPLFKGEVRLSVVQGRQEAGLYGKPSGLRKLHNDHRPADESFTEMMDKLKGEVV